MERCELCRDVMSCPICASSIKSFEHLGVRGTTSKLRVPVIGVKVTVDQHPSGIWHYAQPCGHRIHLSSRHLPQTVAVKYNGGPLWKDGYTWQNVYWGTYFATSTGSSWIQSVDRATADIEADRDYSGGLRQYNVGVGKLTSAVTINQDPQRQISDQQIQKALLDWILKGRVTNLDQTGAYNIFLPPGTTASLSSDMSCAQFCVPSDEVVLGDNKAICDLEAGDNVVGSTGLQTVEGTTERHFSGDLVEITGRGLLPIRLTPEHPVLVVEVRVRKDMTSFSSPTWKLARDVKEKHALENGDCLVVPKLRGTVVEKTLNLDEFVVSSAKAHPRITRFPLNQQTAWLLGVYVAEGNPSVRGLNFALNENETALRTKISECFGALRYPTFQIKQPNENGKRIGCSSIVLARALSSWCGRGATNKHVPDFILYHKDERILRSFLDGYIAGDACKVLVRSKYELIIFNTVSKILVRQLQLAYARLGIFFSIRVSRRAGPSTIQGRQIRLHEQYEGRFYPKQIGDKQDRLHDSQFYIPVKRVADVRYNGQVHNLSTPDHTYLLSNVIVHNCDYHNAVDGSSGPFYTVEPYPCSQGCNQCTGNALDTLTQGLSEEIIELKTDMDPGTGWVIGNLELCDFCDANFVCNRISTGEYVNAWYDKTKVACWIGK